MDLVGPIHPPSSRGNKYVLTVIDMLTGFTMAVPIKNKNAETICDAYRNLKGLFVRECAEGSRCSRKTLCVCVGGGGEMYLLLVRGVSRSKTLIPLILSQSGWMLFITTINNYSPNTYRYRFKLFM